MSTAEINFYIHAAPERVFDALADHERFFHGNRITSSKVVREGRDSKNGLGAVREIHNAGIRFVEEITVFDRPKRFDYLVTECSLPLRHRGGEIHFTPRNGGTEIRWTSRFTVALPLIGRATAEIFRMMLVDEVTRLLHVAKRELEAG